MTNCANCDAAPGLHCIATARDETRGRAAVAELVEDGVPAGSIEFRRLDLDSEESIMDFAAWLGAAHGKIGALVNNAAIGTLKTSQLSP